MGLVRKHSINFSLIYYAGVVLGYVNTVVLFPNILEPDQFGLTRILLSVAIVISQLAQLGTPGMIIRYYPMLKQKVFSIGMVICTGGTIVVLSLLVLLETPITSLYEENSVLFTEHFYLLLPFGASIVYYNLFDSYLRALYKNTFSAFLINVFLRLVWTGLIVAYSLDMMSFDLFIILYTCSYAIMSIISFIYLQYLDKPPLISKYNTEDKSLIRQIRSFNFFTLLAGISSFLINKVDIIMLGSMASLEILGVYAIAAYMGMVIRVPASSIARTAPVLVADSFKKNDLASISSLYNKSAITQLILSASIFILILINYENITYVLPDAYKESYFIFFFLGLTQVIDSAMGINGFIMINSKYYKTETLFSSLLLVLTIITNLILIPIKGGEGAAIATLISISIYNILRLGFIWSKLGMQPFSSKTILGLIVCVTAFAISNLVPVINHFIVDAVVRSTVFAIVFIPAVYYTKLSPEVNQMIDGVLNKLKSYFN